MKEKENEIQVAVFQALQAAGIYAHHSPNEAGTRKVVEMMQLKAMGMRSGFPDLICLWPDGRTIWMELKTKKGKQNESQKLTQRMVADWKAKGHEYVVIRSVDEVIRMIEETSRSWTWERFKPGRRRG